MFPLVTRIFYLPLPQQPRQNLLAKGLNDSFGGFRARKVLLSGNQVPIPHGKPAPQPGLDVIRTDLLHAVLDTPRRYMIVAAEKVPAPDGVAREILSPTPCKLGQQLR